MTEDLFSLIVIAIYCHLFTAYVLFQIFRRKTGHPKEGWIVFTDKQTFYLCLVWPLTATAFLITAIYCRILRRPKPGFHYELVKLLDHEQKTVLLELPGYCKEVIHYQPCTYRKWWKRYLPGRLQFGFRVSYSERLSKLDPLYEQFVGRIVPIQDEQEFLRVFIPEIIHLMYSHRATFFQK